MSPNPPRSSQLSCSSTRVHRDRLSNNESIGNKLSDCLAGVGVGDFVDFVWVEPNLALSATDDGGGEALLGTEIDPVEVTDY